MSGYHPADTARSRPRTQDTMLHSVLAIEPADDLYTFIFDNTEGNGELSVHFLLDETWTHL